jgi:hypothetical protein
MFWQQSEPSAKQPEQSQSLSDSPVVGSQIQITPAGRDATVAQSGPLAAQQQGKQLGREGGRYLARSSLGWAVPQNSWASSWLL